MGDYAEMMLDGTCCCNCGEYLGDGDGFADYCASCKPIEEKDLVPAKQKAPKPRKTVACARSGCARRFVDENAMRNHLRTFHIDKVVLREKQEKDKKLNAMRNAAPALLEALEDSLKHIESLAKYDFDTGEYIDPEVREIIEKINDAIAAARGG